MKSEGQSKVDIREIMAVLPHRQPMLMVDRIVELVPGQRAVGIKNVTANEPVFQGHYPGNPIFPGVLILEAMAQTGAVALLVQPEFAGKVPLFAGVDKCRFRRPVLPGDVLRLEVELVGIRHGIGMGTGKAFVGDELKAEAVIKFALAERPNE